MTVFHRQLAESEALYRGLVENQSELVSLATPEGTLFFVNRAYALHYGKRPQEMVGRSLFDFVPEDGRAAVAEHLQRVCCGDESFENDNQVILPNGDARCIAWTNRALRDAEGRITAIHSVGRDIEHRVVAETRLKASEARYRLLSDNSIDMILLVLRDGKCIYASPACRALLGYEPEEMLTISRKDVIHPVDFEMVLERLSRDEGHSDALRYRMRRKDGSYVWVESVAKSIPEEPGEPPRRLLIVRDIDQRVLAEEQLKENAARYRLLAENSSDMVLELDRNLVRRYVSPACRELLGYEPEEMIGGAFGTMVHPDDAEGLAEVFQLLLSGRLDRHSAVCRRRHRDGRWIWIETQYRSLRDSDTGAPTGIVGSARDISARKAAEDKLAEAMGRLEALAANDALTGLANRRTFDEALLREYARAKKDGMPLALIMIDIDHFKQLNDCHGHPAGDECLRRVSAAIKRSVFRSNDVVARYGGEEFAVLLPGADEAGAAVIGERMRRAIYLLGFEPDAGPYSGVTASVGIASLAPEELGQDCGTLLQCADQALYRAKHEGRNRAICAHSLAVTN